MELRCHACAHTFVVPAGTLSASCEKCGALITLTALETRVRARGLVDRDGEAPEALLGKELGGYTLTAILGGGGMGVVYEAKRTERATFDGPEIAAIKVLSPAFSLDAEFIERFRREADALTKLRHENLIEVYAKGVEPHYFFVMERFYGEDLRSLMARGPVSSATAAAIIRGAARGLAYAHANGIVHRDVKPANILVSGDAAKDGRVKVVDFGVAQLATGQYTLTSLTRSELVLGTINYMSPEQRVDASEVDHRADVYALGVVAYELLTGRLPIGAFEPPSELSRGIGRAADKAVLAALRRDPAQRPRSAELFAETFARALVRRSRTVPYAAAASIAAIAIAFGGGALFVTPDVKLPKIEQQLGQQLGQQQAPPPQQAEQQQQAATSNVDEKAIERTADALLSATELGMKRAAERRPLNNIATKPLSTQAVKSANAAPEEDEPENIPITKEKVKRDEEGAKSTPQLRGSPKKKKPSPKKIDLGEAK